MTEFGGAVAVPRAVRNNGIWCSRFSKRFLWEGAVSGGAVGGSLRGGAPRLGGGSGATGGAPTRGSAASPPGRRSAASRRCAISARFWSALDSAGDGEGGGGGGGGAAGAFPPRTGGPLCGALRPGGSRDRRSVRGV